MQNVWNMVSKIQYKTWFIFCSSKDIFNINTHYDDVIMTMLASQITSLAVVYSIVYSGVNQRKHQSSASLAFVREIHRGPVNFPHKWPVTRKMFPFDDVIMWFSCHVIYSTHNTSVCQCSETYMYLQNACVRVTPVYGASHIPICCLTDTHYRGILLYTLTCFDK